MNDQETNPQQQEPEIPKRRREFTMPGRLLIDEAAQKRMHRWFGWNFTIIMMVLILVLTFIWPLLFKKQDRYIAESAVRNSYTLMTLLREHSLNLTESTQKEILQKLRSHPAFKPIEDNKSPRVYIIDSTGQLQLGNKKLPAYWDEIEMTVLTGQRGVEVYKDDEIMTVFFFDTLPGTEFKIVVNHPYSGMFAPE